MEFIIGGLILGVLLAFPIALMVVIGQKRAIKQAQEMIDSGNPDKKKAKKLLRTLAACNDNEGRRLYSKLADLIGQ